MHGIFSTSVAPYLENGCSYVLDNSSEWAVSLYNIFENTIFHQTVISPKFSRNVKDLQTAFSFASAACVVYDIYALASHLINEGSFAQYLNALTIIASVAAITYIANRIFNWWYPPEENCQQILTVAIPEKTKQKIKVSLIRPVTEYLQTFYLARILLNVCLAYVKPHAIPYAINVLCQMHILSTVVKTRWLKFSRTFSYLTKEERVQRLATLLPFQREFGNSILSANSHEIPEEAFEELLDQLQQMQVPNSPFLLTFNFPGDEQQ